MAERLLACWAIPRPTRRHVLAALSRLVATLAPAPMPGDGPEPEDEAAQAKLLATMTDACDRLQAAGVDHHLVGGVVVGIVRQGRPFAGDKDIDFGVDFDADRDAIAAAFADGYTYMRTPRDADARRWCMGYVHDATGIGVDLFFKQPVDGMLRINLGWPDDLVFDLPAYRVEPFHWQGRDWPMPAPLEDYLAADYGADWRSSTRRGGGPRVRQALAGFADFQPVAGGRIAAARGQPGAATPADGLAPGPLAEGAGAVRPDPRA